MLDRLELILNAQTDNLLELAEIAAPGDRAFFKGATFCGADLRGLDLSPFDLVGASFEGAILDEQTKLPILEPQAYIPVIDALHSEIAEYFINDFDPDRHLIQVNLWNSANQAIDYNDYYFTSIELIYGALSRYRKTLSKGYKVVFSEELRTLSSWRGDKTGYRFEYKGNAILDPESVRVELTLRDNRTKVLSYNTTALNLCRQLKNAFGTYRDIFLGLHPDNSL